MLEGGLFGKSERRLINIRIMFKIVPIVVISVVFCAVQHNLILISISFDPIITKNANELYGYIQQNIIQIVVQVVRCVHKKETQQLIKFWRYIYERNK